MSRDCSLGHTEFHASESSLDVFQINVSVITVVSAASYFTMYVLHRYIRNRNNVTLRVFFCV